MLVGRGEPSSIRIGFRVVQEGVSKQAAETMDSDDNPNNQQEGTCENRPNRLSCLASWRYSGSLNPIKTPTTSQGSPKGRVGVDSRIAQMTAEDYDEVLALWRGTAGVGLDEGTDTQDGIAAYLLRNPGLSFVARRDGKVVGAVLCGHDGRRGYLHHLAVAAAHRHCGVGRALVEACLARLGHIGIRKCNIFLFSNNEAGQEFWKHVGWQERADLKVLQKPTPNGSSR